MKFLGRKDKTKDAKNKIADKKDHENEPAIEILPEENFRLILDEYNKKFGRVIRRIQY